MALSPKSNVSVLVALAGLPAMLLLVRPNPARAQYQVGGNGHALDANNQVGSGGYNGSARAQQGGQSQSTQIQPGGINNNVIYGETTGLAAFRGRVNSFDPTVFQGNTGSNAVDKLNSIAAPVDLTQRTTGMPTYMPYYNTATYAPTPNALAQQTLVQTPGGAGYIPAPVVNPLIPSTDVRLEMTNTDPNLINTIPAPGELDVAGPVDPSGNSSLYSMSPLYGVRQMDSQLSPGADTFFQSKQTNTTLPNTNARLRLTPAQIQSMREELNKTVVPDNQNGEPGSNPGNSGPNAPAAGATNLDQSGSVAGSPISGQVQATPVDNSVSPTPASSGDLSTGQGVQNQLLIPATSQSKQLKALEDKYSKIKHLSDVQATEKFNRENQLRQAAMSDSTKKPAKPGSAAPGTGVPGTGAPGTGAPGLGAPGEAPLTHDQPTTKPGLKPLLTPADNSAADNQPLVITSLATGIQAKGLGDLMKSAEGKMREGKFTEAVDTYESARAVAPNNPLVPLGRSFAELGASYYGKADQDLTRAIIADPAVLAGKYDLNGFLGEDRVKFVSGDLADLAAHQKSARPLVLLAFIAHNTGDDASAAKDLDQAVPRGGYDSLVALMRSTWGLKVDGK